MTLDEGYTDAPVRGVSFKVELPAGTTTIELRSYFFDAYLVVRDANGEVIAEDDDGLLRTHAAVVLQRDALDYIIVDACAMLEAFGIFEMTIRSGTVEELDPRMLADAEIADARHESEARERLLGPKHPDTAASVNNLAILLESSAAYEEARRLYERALAISEDVLGPEHPDTAACLSNLAGLLHSTGAHEEARPLYERALAILEKVLGPEHPDTATGLNNLAVLLQSTGTHEEARPLFERALAIREKVQGPEHPYTAASLNSLAALLKSTGRYEEARPLYERALAINEQVLGKEHSETARNLNNLALLLKSSGAYEEARPLFERALAIWEKVLGPKHPDTATSLNSLATLLASTGAYDEARPLHERALAIREEVLGPEHPDTALSLHNIATLLASTGAYDEALPIYERAQAILEKVLGPEHPDTATSLSSLAELFVFTGEHEESRPLFERALAIREKALGPEHPNTATSLDNLAALLDFSGAYEEARPLYERALAIREAVLDPEHPDTATSLNNLAVLHLDLAEADLAGSLARRRLASIRAHGSLQASLASDQRVREWLAAEPSALGLVVRTTAIEKRSGDPLYGEVLAAKGSAFRMVGARRRKLARQLDSVTRSILERLRSVGSAMSNLFSLREIPNRKQFDEDIERLRKEREELETNLARATDARPDLKPVTPSEVRAALPVNAVLLDFLEHAVYEPAKWTDGEVTELGRWGETRFSVWISRAGWDAPRWVDLGSSAAIEAANNAALRVIVGETDDSSDDPRGARSVESVAKDHAAARASEFRRARQLLWDPLVLHIGDACEILVSPDGVVTTLPWWALQEDDGSHLIESRVFRVIDDVESLVRPEPRTEAARSLLCVGGVDYDDPGELIAKATEHPDRRGAFDGNWSRLPATKAEATLIEQVHARRFPEASRRQLAALSANEETVKQHMPDAGVLHLATHGYFQVEGLKSINDSIREQPERNRFQADERSLVAGYWPEFLCGLVCAGANRPDPGRDNGLLTGDEVSSLDLSRCDLVVLSACETALGKRQAGEGVLSLTRSFRIAGARTVISSLWQVRDDSTKEMMLDFYDRLWNKGEGKLDALRNAQLAMLKRNREKHGDTLPVTWGAFVLTGDAD